MDSFQNTLDADNKNSKLPDDPTSDERVNQNLNALVDDFATEEFSHVNNVHRQGPNEILSDRLRENMFNIEEPVIRYLKSMEDLEFRVERHEQLTKLIQRSIRSLIDEQEQKRGVSKKIT